MPSKLLSSIPNSTPGSKQPSKEQAGGLMVPWNQDAAIPVTKRPWAFVLSTVIGRPGKVHPILGGTIKAHFQWPVAHWSILELKQPSNLISVIPFSQHLELGPMNVLLL